jgi:hypothetical protein
MQRSETQLCTTKAVKYTNKARPLELEFVELYAILTNSIQDKKKRGFPVFVFLANKG